MRHAAFAILLDSLRLLRARKMFGISLMISLLIGVMYAGIGFDSEGMSFFGLWKFSSPELAQNPEQATAFYILLFTGVIVRFWLAWPVVAIGLLSTIPIFPDFLAEGSVGVSLSKPVSRPFLFVWKYIGALLFVALQVALLAVVAFLAIGFRTGGWYAGIFWAVPVVTFVFSLVYCVAVLAAVHTKSAAFSLIAALLVWGTCLMIQWSEDLSYKLGIMLPDIGVEMNPTTGEMTPARGADHDSLMVRMQRRLESLMVPLPKTRECTMALKRLIKIGQQDGALSGLDFDILFSGSTMDPRLREEMEKYEERHGFWYIFGTSAGFELVVLGAAVWIFSRRDY